MQPNPRDPDQAERTPATAADLLKHAEWIRRLARGLVGDAASADDLVQETYVAALRHPPERRVSLRPWLKKVVLNAARQGARGRDRRAQRELLARGPSESPDPQEWVQRIETERRLTEALARLDEPFRSTLMLRYYEGLEPSEIARREGTPAGTVRWRVKRGLELLRERLDGEYGTRSAWSLALLPLARTGTGAAAAAGASSVALTGALAMNVLWKVTGAAVVVVALAYGLAWTGVVPRSFVPFLEEAPVEVSFRPLPIAPTADTVEAAAPKAERAAPRREMLTPAAAPAAVEEVQATVRAPAEVRARLVDAAGNALSGVRLERVGDDAGDGQRSASDGEVTLLLPLDKSEASVDVQFSLSGFASHGERVIARSGETTHLGTIELAAGGAIGGRVVDVDGAPVEGVQITLGDIQMPERVLESMRLQPAMTSVPRATTEVDGAFTLRGVPVGFVRLWAHAEDFLGSYTAPVEVRPGEESYGVIITLEELRAENLVRGIVLDPAGVPVPGAELDYRHSSKSSGTTYAGDRTADNEGRFEFQLRDDALLWLTARDPGGRYGPASVSEQTTGQLDLVLQLGDVQEIELRVRDQAGDPVAHFGFSIVSPDGSFVHQRVERSEHDGGNAGLGCPSEHFLVRVDAPGYELADAGPFDPSFVEAGLDVVLMEAPRLRGRVADANGPVEGARVRLHRLIDDSMLYERNGFRSRLDHNQLGDETRTDGNGEYVLTVRSGGTYIVRADRSGYAPAESTPMLLGAGADERLDLRLSQGGAIEGRLLLPGGEDAAGRILGLSRLDGYARTLRVGPDGSYRFDQLTPGPWMLTLRDEEIVPGTTTTRTSSDERQTPYEELDWTCEVYEGETTYFDLALAGQEACRLRGRFLVDGGLEEICVAKLVPYEKIFLEDGPSVVLDPGGRFEITAPKAGKYWLSLMRSIGETSEQYLVDVVRLSLGETDWEYELVTGSLVVGGAGSWNGEDMPAAVHMWEGPNEMLGLTVVAGGEDGVAHMPGLPAGEGRIVRPDESNLDFRTWETLLEVEVPAGGEGRAQLR